MKLLNPSKFVRYLARAVKLAALTLVLFFAALLLMMALNIRIELSALNKPIELAMERALGREVYFNGSISLLSGPSPKLLVKDVSISNPQDFAPGIFARAERVLLQIRLSELLRSEISVNNIEADGLTVYLRNDEAGKPNWRFTGGAQKKGEAKADAGATEAPYLSSIDQFELKDVDVFYRDEQGDLDVHWHLGRVSGGVSMRDELKVKFDGHYEQQPYALDLEGGNLGDYYDLAKTWPLKLNGHVAGAPIELEVALNTCGERASTLSGVVGDVHAGALLAWLGIADNLEGRIGKAQLDAVLRGCSLSRLLADSEASIRVSDVQWLWPDRQMPSSRTIEVSTGLIAIAPGSEPELVLEGVRISNPASQAPGVFAELGHLVLQPRLAALQHRQLVIERLEASAVTLNLRNDADGEPNWRSSPVQVTPSHARSDTAPLYLAALHRLQLEDLNVFYIDESVGRGVHGRVEKLAGGVSLDDPLQLTFGGRYEQQPFDFSVDGGNLRDFYDLTKQWPIALSGSIVDTPLEIKGLLHAANDDGAIFHLELGYVHIGKLLSWLGVAGGVNASAKRLTIDTVLRGDSLHRLLEASEMRIFLDDAQWTLIDRYTRRVLPISISFGSLVIEPGKRPVVHMDATIGDTPLSITLRSAQLQRYLEHQAKLPFSVDVSVEETKLAMETVSALPFTLRDQRFQFSMSGPDLSSLSESLALDLPPLGPYRLSGAFINTKDGYSVDTVELEIGSSTLAGHASLNMQKAPPFLNVDLVSESVQLNDFVFEDWSPFEASDDNIADTDGVSEAQAVSDLTSRSTLEAIDADIVLDVRKVLSGNDPLGRGTLRLKLSGGELRIEPVKISLPGGDADLKFVFRPGVSLGRAELSLLVDNFHYGILARRIDPESAVSGRVSLDISLQGDIDNMAELLASSSGRFNFAIWPDSLEASVFEMWAVNVVTAALFKIDRGNASRVNCVVGKFSLEHGVLRDDLIFADTTRMRILGDATADFVNEKLELYLEPKAKQPEFFSLATPVSVSGKFDEFELSANPVDLAGSMISFVTSPVHVPLRRVFADRLPHDGTAACQQAWVQEVVSE